MIRRSPPLTALAATLLALAVTAGVSTPRPRVPGRDRFRSVALAGNSRTEEPCAWIAHGNEPEPDHAVTAGDVVAAAAASTATDGMTRMWAPAADLTFAAALPSRLLDEPPTATRHGRQASRPSRGRAPPSTRS